MKKTTVVKKAKKAKKKVQKKKLPQPLCGTPNNPCK
jgi:hypothetical protein